MHSLLVDYAERFVLAYAAAVAFIAGGAGLLALPASGLLLAFRKQWASGEPPSGFPVMTPFLLLFGGAWLSYAAYNEYQRRKPALFLRTAPAGPTSPWILVAFVILTGPVLAVVPFLYRWLAGVSGALERGGLTGEFSILLAPIWMGVMLPSACLVALAATLAMAGPAGLTLCLGGSQRTGRIMLLFWELQLLLLVSSVPTLYNAKTPGPEGEAIGFACVLLSAVVVGYLAPVLALRRASCSEQTPAPEPPSGGTRSLSQPPQKCFAAEPASPVLPGLRIPQNSFLVRRGGSWRRFVRIAPPVFIISAPAYNTAGPCLLRASAEGGLPVVSFLLESEAAPLCRIRRRIAFLATTAYVVEDALSGRMLFELSRTTADGADWSVVDWRRQPLGSLSLRQAGLPGIDFDLLIGGVPCVRYFWQKNVLLPEISGEWQEPVPEGFHPLLAISVGVALAHFLPEGLSKSRNWWR